MILKWNDLNQKERCVFFLFSFFCIWPIFHFDWTASNYVWFDANTCAFQSCLFRQHLAGNCSPNVSNLKSGFIKYQLTDDANFIQNQVLKVEKTINDMAFYNPSNCEAQSKVAILIPYRQRKKHLNILIPYLHAFLYEQKIAYELFVIEQDDQVPFNKGQLYNAAFKEIHKLKIFNCFIFHDVDLLPENQLNLYQCDVQPKHLSVQVSSLRYVLPYPRLIGGVIALLPRHYELVNGFSNNFYGWGGEDDQFFERLSQKSLTVLRCLDVGKYTMISHKHAVPSFNRKQAFQKSSKNIHLDGLKNVKYKVNKVIKKRLYTHYYIQLYLI